MCYHCQDVIPLTECFWLQLLLLLATIIYNHIILMLSSVTATVSLINHLSIVSLICILMLEITAIKITKKLLVTLVGYA